MSRLPPVMQVVLVAALAGCAAYPRAATPAIADQEPEGSVDDYAARIEGLERELSAELGSAHGAQVSPGGELPASESVHEPAELAAPAPAAPDCDAAPRLRDRICELAERICALAERDATDARLGRTCSAARESCAQARERVETACGL